MATPSNRGLRQLAPAPEPPRPRGSGRSLVALVAIAATVGGGLVAARRFVESEGKVQAGALAAAAGRVDAVLATAEPASEPACDAGDAACDASAPADVADAREDKDEADAGAEATLDVELVRDGPSAVPGGVLLLPRSFEPTSSAFDLVVHFHGDAEIVRASLEAAEVDAAVVVLNFGAGSSAYYRAYQSPDAFQSLLRQAERVVEARGLPEARVGRIALSAWGVGQAALTSALVSRRGAGQLDAVLLCDGIFGGGTAGAPLPGALEPLVAAARAAGDDELLLSITYSQVDPHAPAVVAALADAAGTTAPEPLDGERPAPLRTVSLPGVTVAKRAALQPLADARRGGFHARSFAGGTTQEHLAQLTQMAATTLRELGRRWSAPSAASGGEAE